MHSCAFGCGINKKDIYKLLDLQLPDNDNTIEIDAEIDFDDLNYDDFENILKFDKFYMSGFDRPVIRVNNIPLDKTHELGKSFSNKGFVVKPNEEISFIKFNGLSMDELRQVLDGSSMNLVGSINRNSYDKKIQLIIEDYEVSDSQDNNNNYEFIF